MDSRYFSVKVVRALESFKCLIRISLDRTVGELANLAIERVGLLPTSSTPSIVDDDGLRIEKIMAFDSASSSDVTTNGNIVDASTPLHVIVDFNLMFVTVFLVCKVKVSGSKSNSTPSSGDNDKQGKNAFDEMMSSNIKYDCLPPSKNYNNLRKDHRMFNDILSLLKEMNVGFTAHNVNSLGKQFVSTLHNTLWYITSQHHKFKDRGLQIPDIFQKFSGYYDNKACHKGPPQMQESKLRSLIDEMSDFLMIPWTMKFTKLFNAVEGLINILKKYADFLCQQNIRSQARNASMEPLRNPNINFSLTPIQKLTGPIRADYMALDATLSVKEPYEFLDLVEFLPEERFDRRSWLEHMQLPYPVAHYTYFHGNYLGNINFIWKLPPEDERSDDKTVKTVQQISEYIPTFSTRYIRQQFLNKYVQATNSPKAVLRNLYRFLTNDCSSAETEDQEVIDKRVEEVISLQDPELTWDLRKMNGNARNSKFDIFWTELDNYFNEINLAVHERRHGQHMYLPYAISIEDLVSIIKKRLPENTPIPSNEWVRLQFWPTNPNTITALRYTARFEVKFTIQSRQIRGQHEDSHYVAVQLQYIKAFAVKYREFTDFLWMDDKAIVPIGEPGLPVSTGVRPHNRSLAPKSGPSISALDHDYNVCGAIPSVTFKCDIPEAASSSFFNGIAFVTVKDKVFSPSNAIRHGCETTNILRTHYSQDDTQVNAEHPILIMYTDGGPDHRTTFGSVQIAAICMFMWLDLDFLITARTAPMGSWANLAERVNSNLNLALQNVSLSREHMTDNLEMKMRGINSLKAARDTARRYPAFKEGLIQSVAPVIELLQERFGHLKLKGEPIVISPSANQESIDDFFKIVKDLIDQNLIENKLTKPDLEKSATLQDFMKKHCRLRNYTFQIKKCANALIENCAYCLFNPPRLPDEVFDTLSFVPDPVVASNNKYESFETVYGQATNDLARPSLMLSSQNKEIDKKNRKILNATKVRDAVLCVECGKPRCVYSETKLTYIEKQAVDRLKELNSFTCGSPLFPHSSKYNSSIIVREGLRCCSTMETTYYSKSTVSLPAVCFHCGVAKSSDFAADQNIQSLQAQYSVVRPICVKCKDDGKEAIVRGKRNVKRLRKM